MMLASPSKVGAPKAELTLMARVVRMILEKCILNDGEVFEDKKCAVEFCFGILIALL